MLLLEGGNVRASWPGIDFVAGVRFCDSRMGWEAEMDSRGTDRCLFCRPALHPRQSGCEPWDGQQRALLARGPCWAPPGPVLVLPAGRPLRFHLEVRLEVAMASW